MKTIMYSAKPIGTHCSALSTGTIHAGIDLHEDGCDQAGVVLNFDSSADALAAAGMLTKLAGKMRFIEQEAKV